MPMLVGGEWREALSGRIEEITSPFDGAVVATVPRAGVDDAGAAVTAAEVGAVIGVGRRRMNGCASCCERRS